MNSHLLQEAGYLRLDPELKLALMHLAANTDEDTRLTRASIEGTALWADCDTLADAWALHRALEARGLIRVVEPSEDPLYEITTPCDCPDGEGWLK